MGMAFPNLNEKKKAGGGGRNVRKISCRHRTFDFGPPPPSVQKINKKSET